MLVLCLDEQIRMRRKTGTPFSEAVAKHVLLQVCSQLTASTPTNSVINPYNILVLDDFKIQVANLVNKTTQGPNGTASSFYVGPELTGHFTTRANYL